MACCFVLQLTLHHSELSCPSGLPVQWVCAKRSLAKIAGGNYLFFAKRERPILLNIFPKKMSLLPFSLPWLSCHFESATQSYGLLWAQRPAEPIGGSHSHWSGLDSTACPVANWQAARGLLTQRMRSRSEGLPPHPAAAPPEGFPAQPRGLRPDCLKVVPAGRGFC